LNGPAMADEEMSEMTELLAILEQETEVATKTKMNADYVPGIVTVLHGAKAIKIIESENPPDLVLLDIMMPEMDGIAVCKYIKKNPLLADIPIIFLTAKTDQESLVEAFESGGVDYINKPVIASELKVRIKNHLQLKFAHDALNEQVDNIMHTIRLRDDVERMVQHDLKTPISSIINLSSTLLEEQKENKDCYDKVNQIESSAYRLMDMINQSLSLYRIESGSYEFLPKKVDIIALLNQVLQDIQPIAENYAVTIKKLHFPEEAPCLLEELLCYSVFSNLIKNSLEASNSKSQVSIEVKLEEKHISTSIHNEQPVPEVVRSTFFSKYVTHGKKNGSGIGTYSAKLLVEAQQGTISMETDSNNGTTITVKFLIAS